jgi:uncharacterized lipoprotein YddW (UPF0748 family)
VLPLFSVLAFYLYYPLIYLTLRPDFNNFSSESLSQDWPQKHAKSAEMRKIRHFFVFFAFLRGYFLISIVSVSLSSNLGRAANYVPSPITPPKLDREIRAAWVATVANIDWPSTNTLTTAQQKAELSALLDRAKELKLNTVIFQVRPGCDAFYASTLEPWSEYLTGTMGKAPEPFYDPLTFAVEEAHKRGLELHAWFNPYRARHERAVSPVSANHISRMHPELVRQYGKYLWLDPGEKGVQDYSLRVVMDVVRRYDIDGVHFDDYFYPYSEKDQSGQDIDFPDAASWQRYGAAGKLSRADWRRENVNAFIHRVYEEIKATKPWVKFGLSPFGIWRPHNPPSVQGYDAYDKLFADSRKWLFNGWLDYFAPQLYWAIDAPEQSFPELLKWWAEQNPKGRHLAPGMDSTKAGHRWSPDEIVNQIRLARKQPGVDGHIHWNMKALMRNGALDSALEREVYQQPALFPASPWLERAPPEKPAVMVSKAQGAMNVTWQSPSPVPVRFWVLQTRHGKEWSTEILSGERRSHALVGALPEVLALTALDRCGNTSAPTVLERTSGL